MHAVVTVNARVDEQVLRRFPNLRLVATAFTGYDCADLAACKKRGIKVYNVPSYSTDSVAELTIALAVALLRGIPGADKETRDIRDEREASWKGFGPGIELAGKTVGIIGTGRIGLRAAELFRAFKCPLIAWSRNQREEFSNLDGLIRGEYVPKEEVFSRADVVSLHIGLNDETRGFVGKKLLALMKPDACLINTARGPIVDKEVLVEALGEKRIRAAIDVFDQEPLPADDPLLQFPERTILTPHIAYKTREALERRARITIENIRRRFEGDHTNRVA